MADNYIAKILSAIQACPDLIQFNAYCFFENNPLKNYHLSQPALSGLYTVNDEILYEIFNKNNWFSWLRTYKRELLLSNPFPTNMTHFEDAFIVSKIFTEIQTIFIIKESIYKYRILESSATREKNLLMKDRLLNSCALLINELIQNTQEKKVFTIPLVHFSYIYIDESKNVKDILSPTATGEKSQKSSGN